MSFCFLTSLKFNLVNNFGSISFFVLFLLGSLRFLKLKFLKKINERSDEFNASSELKLYFENLLNVEHEGVIVSEPLSIPTKESIALKMGLDILTVEMILDNFFLTLEDDLQKLEIAHKNQDEQTVKTMAHYLKGASANLFLEKAVALLESIESQPLGSQEAVQKLRNYFNALSQ